MSVSAFVPRCRCRRQPVCVGPMPPVPAWKTPGAGRILLPGSCGFTRSPRVPGSGGNRKPACGLQGAAGVGPAAEGLRTGSLADDLRRPAAGQGNRLRAETWPGHACCTMPPWRLRRPQCFPGFPVCGRLCSPLVCMRPRPVGAQLGVWCGTECLQGHQRGCRVRVSVILCVSVSLGRCRPSSASQRRNWWL